MQGVPHGVMTGMLVPARPGGDMRAKTDGAFRAAASRVGTGATRALGRILTLGARTGVLGGAQMATQGRARIAALEAVPPAVPPAFPRVTRRVGLSRQGEARNMVETTN